MKTYNDTTYAILGILTTDCKTGYEIKQLIDRSLNHFWKISYGQIYPALKLIVDEGLAEVNNVENEGRPDKKEYHLTPKGFDVLKQWLDSPIEQLPNEKNEILLKLFFGQYQSHERTISILQSYLEKLEARYLTYQGIEESILVYKHKKQQDDAAYWLFTLDYGKRVTHAAIEWCRETIKKCEEERNDV
ncbi:PadR family transcriptional regulator [Bacillus lacus]|uniref:PadR family transcriptional regulator n=1 Tax=Metabacillus lacus TaxID=1983721 RepID=A0A7X2LXF6_9BACI|nr:PadR family transcriptional regulator [Metabacillus lacus]MRX71241.1 PadR family transcriptional regulator [Metabacillus lacus]